VDCFPLDQLILVATATEWHAGNRLLMRGHLAHAHLDTREEFLGKGYTDRIQLVFYELRGAWGSLLVLLMQPLPPSSTIASMG
jgi:hypothetical protein